MKSLIPTFGERDVRAPSTAYSPGELADKKRTFTASLLSRAVELIEK